MYDGTFGPRTRGDQTWHEQAACAAAVEVARDPDLFFPSTRADEQRVGLAKRLCSACQVRKTCLEAALEGSGADGIRGGMTEVERKAARHQFELRCDPARVDAAMSGRDVYLTGAERRELIRRAARSGTPTLRVASVLKVSEGHVKKLLRLERREIASACPETLDAAEATYDAISA
ncbi:WhiB family transcriptional regulator [Streptomyces phaeochromogenes]|uniref:WhiB family transcriptional regulator n=1 Tax=Streptomyces phaeochromogenes TaxID=1923 RepID=UPI00398C9250